VKPAMSANMNVAVTTSDSSVGWCGMAAAPSTVASCGEGD
jgi:hypothetical protein